MNRNIAMGGLLLLLSAGCATSGARETIRPKPIQMIGDFEATEAARFAHLADVDRDGTAAADVRVCVAPSGDVASAELLASSGSPEFDRALTRDLARATYHGFSAPAEVKVCSDLRLVISEG